MYLAVLRSRTGIDDESDEALIDLARLGGENAIRALIKRNNRRLFRIARAVLRDDFEAEDVVQETYVKAFTKLDSFRGDARFSTWLTRIALNEAIGRKRRRRSMVEVGELDLDAIAHAGSIPQKPYSLAPLPADDEVMRGEMRAVLEAVIDELPESFRRVFILRDVEGMNVEETSRILNLRSNTVKTRLYRAHRLLRAAIEKRQSTSFSDIFPFGGARCAGMAERVVAAILAAEGSASSRRQPPSTAIGILSSGPGWSHQAKEAAK